MSCLIRVKPQKRFLASFESVYSPGNCVTFVANSISMIILKWKKIQTPSHNTQSFGPNLACSWGRIHIKSFAL